MIKLKRMSGNKCNVLINIKLDECDLDLLDTFGLINEKEIKTHGYDTDKPTVEGVTNETVLLRVLSHQVSKKLSSEVCSTVSRELFFRFIHENLPDCLVYNFKDILPDAMIMRNDVVFSHENTQGVKHLKKLFPNQYSRVFNDDIHSSCYLGSVIVEGVEKGIILLDLVDSLLLNTFTVFHEWGHHLYMMGSKNEKHKIPCRSYKHYRCHIGKSSWEEKRCDWYAIKTIYETQGAGFVKRTLVKLNEQADSESKEYPFVDNKYRVELLRRLARRYFKVDVDFAK